MKNIELYVKGGLEDKIAFLCVLVAILITFIFFEVKNWWEENKQAKEIIRAICEGYASTKVGEREMTERIQKAEAFLKE